MFAGKHNRESWDFLPGPLPETVVTSGGNIKIADL